MNDRTDAIIAEARKSINNFRKYRLPYLPKNSLDFETLLKYCVNKNNYILRIARELVVRHFADEIKSELLLEWTMNEWPLLPKENHGVRIDELWWLIHNLLISRGFHKTDPVPLHTD